MADIFSLLLHLLDRLLDRWGNKGRLNYTIFETATPTCIIYQEPWNTIGANFPLLKSYDQLIKISLHNSSDKPISYFDFEILEKSSRQPIDFLTQAKIDNELIVLITTHATTSRLLPDTHYTLQGHSHLEMITAIKANVGTKIRVSFKTDNRIKPISRVIEITQKPTQKLNPEMNVRAQTIINVLSNNSTWAIARTGQQDESAKAQDDLTNEGIQLTNDAENLKDYGND